MVRRSSCASARPRRCWPWKPIGEIVGSVNEWSCAAGRGLGTESSDSDRPIPVSRRVYSRRLLFGAAGQTCPSEWIGTESVCGLIRRNNDLCVDESHSFAACSGLGRTMGLPTPQIFRTARGPPPTNWSAEGRSLQGELNVPLFLPVKNPTMASKLANRIRAHCDSVGVKAVPAFPKIGAA